MGRRRTGEPNRDRAWTTTRSFDDHGIVDGRALVRRTYYRLVGDGDGTFEPSAAYFDPLADAFLRTYLTKTGEYAAPDHVVAAIDDARAVTAETFADEPSADLRTDVVPAFYRQVAGFHYRYRSR